MPLLLWRYSLDRNVPPRLRPEVGRQRREDNLRTFPVVYSCAAAIALVLSVQNRLAPVVGVDARLAAAYGWTYLALLALSLAALPFVVLRRRLPERVAAAAVGVYTFGLFNWCLALSYLDLASRQGYDAFILGLIVFATVYRCGLRDFLAVTAWAAAVSTPVFAFVLGADPGWSSYISFYLYCGIGVFFFLVTESLRVETSILRASLRDALEEQREASVHDPLTGLYNRRYLEDMMTHYLTLSQRQGYPISFLMLDLDHFKEVNDRFGHPEGDRVIARGAELAKAALRGYDLIFRYGGEEFLAVLVDCETHAAAAVAERLRQSFAETDFGLEGRKQTVSIGVATVAVGGRLAAALDEADARLYRAKTGGRDRVVAD
jgi:diguanylate cyclase (GGDEF)-like protein